MLDIIVDNYKISFGQKYISPKELSVSFNTFMKIFERFKEKKNVKTVKEIKEIVRKSHPFKILRLMRFVNLISYSGENDMFLDLLGNIRTNSFKQNP